VRVSVIVPTRHEAPAIGRVLADLPSGLVSEVIVVDNHSSDETPDIAARMGACVIHQARRGYGRACLTGLINASDPDVVVFWMATTAIGRPSFQFSPLSPSVRVSQVSARAAFFPGMPIGSLPARSPISTE